MALTVLAVFQWFNAWNCRSATESLWRTDVRSNLYLVGATVIVIALQLSAVYLAPLQYLLHTVPLAPMDWAIVMAVASSIIFAEELRKMLYRLRASA